MCVYNVYIMSSTGIAQFHKYKIHTLDKKVPTEKLINRRAQMAK